MSIVGKPIDRVDARQKVTGAARYAAEYPFPDLAHAFLVTSTIAKGRIARLEARAAEEAAGVLAVLTHANAPRMKTTSAFDGSNIEAGASSAPILQTDRISWHGQPIAVVVAETLEQARYAAGLVEVEYAPESAALTLESDARIDVPDQIVGEPPEVEIGDAESALKTAEVAVDQSYRTPRLNHNPIEPHATTAAWNRDELTVYDSTQFLFGIQSELAARFRIKAAKIRVVAPFVGGGFGGKALSWPHVYLTVAASKAVGRPVKMALAREPMYACGGGRTATRQRVAVGASRDGRLTALIQTGRTSTSTSNEMAEQFTFPARLLHACPNRHLAQELIELDICPPTWMRAPGEAPGTFALESAMDELSYAVGIDPVELRLRNDPEIDPVKGIPFSSRKFKEAYRLGAEKFGWERRDPVPRSMRDGRYLVGMGVASATYPVYQFPASAQVEIFADGTATVRSGCQEMGMGTATAQTQVAAEVLGLPVEKVRFELGDTVLPFAMVAGGSSQTISVGSAVVAACEAAKEELLSLAWKAKGTPLADARSGQVTFRDGGLARAEDPFAAESFAAILERAGRASVKGDASTKPGKASSSYSLHSFGAQFCEVRVDPDLGEVRVVRFVGAFDVGRVINAKTTRSQLIGGITMGLGMALMEATRQDERNGRIVNANLADYLIPTHADVPEIEVCWVGTPDPHTPLGAHGVGEIGITGVAAAVANAVYHATGRRIREVPIRVEDLLDFEAGGQA